MSEQERAVKIFRLNRLRDLHNHCLDTTKRAMIRIEIGKIERELEAAPKMEDARRPGRASRLRIRLRNLLVAILSQHRRVVKQ